MSDPIIQFITKYVPLTDAEIAIIQEQSLICSYKANSILLSEGEYSKECFFVLTGCVRRYYLIDGNERSVEFFTEGQPITPVSYLTRKPSEYYLSCIEDCIIAVGTADRNRALLEQIPKLRSLLSQINSELLMRSQISFDNFKNYRPEQRYLNLMESRSDLFRRVPLNFLATYLGITPVSLSRMRKRLTTGKSHQLN